MSNPKGYRDRANDGLLSLVGDVPGLVRNLVVAEVNSAKTWIAKVSKDAGIGAVWFIVALFFLFWTVPVFGAFVIIGLSSWWPWWVSALVVFGLMLVLVAVFALLGIMRMKKLSSSESPVGAAKTDVKIVKEIADEL